MPGSSTVAILNPLVDGSPSEVGLVVSTLATVGLQDRILVIGDTSGFPVAYQFPHGVAAKQSVFLSLLSTLNAAIDARLLQALFGEPVAVLPLPVSYPVAEGRHEFYMGPWSQQVYCWTALRAVEEIGRAGPGRRDLVPFAAVMPFHAGDVLFLALAARRGTTPFRSIVVDRRYCDVLEEVAPDLERIEVDLSSRVRNGGLEWDTVLFEAIESNLPQGYFYVYFRPSRLYDLFPVHLIDQYAFALGSYRLGHNAHEDALAPSRGLEKCPRRVLLHFDAGWSMKVYPESLQHELIATLCESGFAVTVLARREECNDGVVRYVRFHGLQDLRALLLDHAILVGMDSFPAHYAAYALGVPTVCLFASTHPSNSDAAQSPRYRAMQRGIDCCPCGGVTRCPRYGGEQCRNFVAPTEVAAVVREMWSNCYGERA